MCSKLFELMEEFLYLILNGSVRAQLIFMVSKKKKKKDILDVAIKPISIGYNRFQK